MAFTTFGTGLGAMAQGAAYTPNWGQEQQAMVQMGQTIMQYHERKAQLAKENYEVLKTVVLPNEGDQEEYNAFAKSQLLKLNDFARSNPGYLTDPVLYAKYRSMAAELQDNPTVRSAADFKLQQDTFMKHAAEDPGYIKSPEGALAYGKMQYRAKYGKAAFQANYSEDDFMFSKPKLFDYSGQFKSFANQFLPESSNIEYHGNYAYTRNKTDMNKLEKAAELFIKMYPEQAKRYTDDWNSSAHPDNQLAPFEAIKQGIAGSITQEDKLTNPVKVYDPNEALEGELLKKRIAHENRLAAKEEYDNMSPFEKMMKYGNGQNDPFLPLGLPNRPITDAKGIVGYKYLGPKFSGLQIDKNGNPAGNKALNPNLLEREGIEIRIPIGAAGSLIDAGNSKNLIWDAQLYSNTPDSEKADEIEAYINSLDLGVVVKKTQDMMGNWIITADMKAINTAVNLNSLATKYNYAANKKTEKNEENYQYVPDSGTTQKTTSAKLSGNGFKRLANDYNISEDEMKKDVGSKVVTSEGVSYRIKWTRTVNGVDVTTEKLN